MPPPSFVGALTAKSVSRSDVSSETRESSSSVSHTVPLILASGIFPQCSWRTGTAGLTLGFFGIAGAIGTPGGPKPGGGGGPGGPAPGGRGGGGGGGGPAPGGRGGG
eukprot:scaffold15672_cov26-Tisochrysis_lutea.AAC.1